MTQEKKKKAIGGKKGKWLKSGIYRKNINNMYRATQFNYQPGNAK